MCRLHIGAYWAHFELASLKWFSATLGASHVCVCGCIRMRIAECKEGYCQLTGLAWPSSNSQFYRNYQELRQQCSSQQSLATAGYVHTQSMMIWYDVLVTSFGSTLSQAHPERIRSIVLLAATIIKISSSSAFDSIAYRSTDTKLQPANWLHCSTNLRETLTWHPWSPRKKDHLLGQARAEKHKLVSWFSNQCRCAQVTSLSKF